MFYDTKKNTEKNKTIRFQLENIQQQCYILNVLNVNLLEEENDNRL